jgi:hypothetical protein
MKKLIHLFATIAILSTASAKGLRIVSCNDDKPTGEFVEFSLAAGDGRSGYEVAVTQSQRGENSVTCFQDIVFVGLSWSVAAVADGKVRVHIARTSLVGKRIINGDSYPQMSTRSYDIEIPLAGNKGSREILLEDSALKLRVID